jgi:S-formylglutathione hydrolase FrmB
MRGRLAAGAVACCLALAGCSLVPESSSPSPSSAPSLATIGRPADDGARIVKVETLDPRTRDLTVESPAVGSVMVRLLLPSTFADEPAARFPVLYLLHGGGGDYTDWTSKTNVDALTTPTRLLVVMPAALSSRLDDWFKSVKDGGRGFTKENPPGWEAFHVTELPQLIERNWQGSDARGIAGLSLGGYAAIVYAARHPGTYKIAASFSGALGVSQRIGQLVQTRDSRVLARLAEVVAQAKLMGGYSTVALAPDLKGTALYISYGNGVPGPLDPPTTTTDDPFEEWCGGGGELFKDALRQDGIPATLHAYGPGTHLWPYWERELGLSLPTILKALGAASTAPSPSPGS